MDLGGCAASEPFVLQVDDDSMEPEFKYGCVIVIDPAGTARHGDYVLAKIEFGNIFRQLLLEDNQHFIQPLNKSYRHEKRPIELSSIMGVVVQQAGGNGRRSERKRY